jgi:hypothetical protein
VALLQQNLLITWRDEVDRMKIVQNTWEIDMIGAECDGEYLLEFFCNTLR